VVHHDIKPENILVDSNDDAKLSDFGISVKLEDDESDQIFNQEWGTKLYLPPEAWSSSRHSPDAPMYGKTMDVWALGCTFYKMIFGVTPFSPDLRPAELGKSIIHDP
jgi:serine/threonine protein kinase